MVGATKPEGARRFHGRGKRVAKGGGVYEHRRELEGERKRKSRIQSDRKARERERGRERERERGERIQAVCRTHTFNHVPAFSQLSTYFCKLGGDFDEWTTRRIAR